MGIEEVLSSLIVEDVRLDSGLDLLSLRFVQSKSANSESNDVLIIVEEVRNLAVGVLKEIEPGVRVS